MSRARSLGLALLLGATTALPASASEPVEAMLDTVAASAFDGQANVAGFIDFTALYEEHGLEVSGATLPALLAGDPDDQHRLITALRRIGYPAAFLSFIFVEDGGWHRWYGFDMLDVAWTLEGGQLPDQLLYLGLDTTARAEAIRAVLVARDFTVDTIGDIPLFSRGTDGGVDIRNREPGRPFGGELGGAEFLALLPQALLGSRFSEVTATAAPAPRAADDPSLTAGIRAVDSDALPGRLMQFVVVRSNFSPEHALSLLAPDLSPTEAQATLDTQVPGPLPAFETLLFADRQDGGAEEALVALVYDSAEDAARAAETLPLRVDAYQMIARTHTLGDLLGGARSVEVVEQDGKHVVLLRIAYQADEIEEGRGALGYQRLLSTIMTRDTAWLTWTD
ncbi:MAG: hypothetical protein KF809_13515 [Chloroflexi bacterium]|nr:hypothetical protein [Chloroflexota bacterium]